MSAKETIKRFVPCFLLSFYHYFLAGIGSFIYRFPSKKIKVIGVTGTKGKSTVVDLTSRILEEAGYKVASISSIRFKIDNKEWPNRLKMAMPGRFKIQRFLRRALRRGCEYVVLEVSSEGIKQHRHKFIDFDIAVFTNLAPEHIEAHNGFDNYRKAKLELFEITKDIHVINLDDDNARPFLEIPVDKEYGYTVENPQVTVTNTVSCSCFSTSEDGIIFKVKDTQFNLNLLGKFNVYNSLAAIAVGLSQSVSLEVCKTALEKVKTISGRMEVIAKEPFTVIVDYAHTPDSLEAVYKDITGFKPENSKLICVLGSCGGGRDKWKRPELGKIASQYCQEIIITNEDPYDEDPMEIIAQVAEKAGKEIKKILNRREAIREALKTAQPKDVVIITGKGSEPWMCVKGGRRISWDDRKIVREELNI